MVGIWDESGQTKGRWNPRFEDEATFSGSWDKEARNSCFWEDLSWDTLAERKGGAFEGNWGPAGPGGSKSRGDQICYGKFAAERRN